jgi:hypothetical protein
MVNGHKIKCKVAVSLLGPTVVAMKASTSTIKRKDAVASSGRTVEAMMDIGAQVIKRASVFTTMQKEKSALAAGKMEKELNGYPKQNSIKKPKGINKRIRDEQ